jgi:hypothetical protein
MMPHQFSLLDLRQARALMHQTPDPSPQLFAMDRRVDMILNEALMHFAPPPSSSPTPWANAN